MENEEYIQNFSRKLQGDLGLEGRILKWILRKASVRMWNGFIWFRIGGFSEYSHFINSAKFLD